MSNRREFGLDVKGQAMDVTHVVGGLGSAVAAILGYVAKSFLRSHSDLKKSHEALAGRVSKNETLIEERKGTLDAVFTQQAVDTHRITQTEGRLEALTESFREMRDTAEKRHTELSSKLELLPAIRSTLDNLTDVCKQLMPREVHDAQMDSLDERLTVVERSVRDSETH